MGFPVAAGARVIMDLEQFQIFAVFVMRRTPCSRACGRNRGQGRHWERGGVPFLWGRGIASMRRVMVIQEIELSF